MIRVKDGVSLDRVHPRLFFVVATAAAIWDRYGSRDLWITAANEGGHATNPDPARQFHRLPDGTCQAVDLRSWTIESLEDRRAAARALAAALGPAFDVLYERPGQPGEHVHVQLDEARPGTVLA